MTEMLRISDFEGRYQVSRSTVYRLRDRGEIIFVHIGRSVRIPRESAERWFAALMADNSNDE